MVITVEKLMKRRHAIRKRADTDMEKSQDALKAIDSNPIILKSHIDILRRHEKVLTELNNQIWDELDELDVNNEDLVESEDFQVRLISCISVLNSTIAKMEREENQRNGNHGDSNNSQATNGNHGEPINHTPARLPTLDLPRFNGDPLKWHVFWDAYDASIYSRPNLQDVEKFSYLRSLLKGSAADAIEGISTTNANYTTAIELVKERFGQKQTVINAHVDALTNLPRSTEDTTKLRALYDQFEIHIRGLETLGVSASDGVILTSILFNKLPAEVRLLLTEKHQKQIGDLDSLRKWLRSHIEAREVSQFSKKSFTRNSAEEPRYTTGSLLTPTSENMDIGLINAGPTEQSMDVQKLSDRNVCVEIVCTRVITSKIANREIDANTAEKKHNSLICQQGTRDEKQSYQVTNNVVVNPGSTQTTESSPRLVSTSTAIWMQTAQTLVFDPFGQPHTIRILFDTGSHRSYVTESLSQKLQLTAQSTEILSIAPFGHQESVPRKFKIVSLDCHSSDLATKHTITAVVTPMITSPIYRAPISSMHAFEGLQLADPPSEDDTSLHIDVLIGLDHYWELVNGQSLRFNGINMTAVHSSFGWLVSGNAEANHKSNTLTTLLTGTSNPASDEFLTKFWEIENIPEKLAPQAEHDMVLNQFNNNIEHVDERYQVCLPWKDEPLQLPDNYGLAKTRFKRLITRLNKESLIPQYQEVIPQQIERKFIEPVDNPTEYDGTLHYISHHPVIRKDHTTTKLRVVYDASAKQTPTDPSLNECLYTGPNIIGDILPLLMEFRFQEVVLLADIEKAFLQVGLHPKDRDATRFFWLKDPTKPAFENNIQIYRSCRVLFGATCSPFLLAATIKFHLHQSNLPTAKKMTDKFYVDNLVTGCETVTEAETFYKEAKKIMFEAGMNLREWISNSETFMETVPEEDRASGPDVKVLGLQWNIKEDSIKVKGVPMLADTQAQSKRVMLQTIAKNFDPLGFVAPVVISAKIFIQSLWKLKLAWDDTPPEDLQSSWKKINKQLTLLANVKLQRKLNQTFESTLHVFVDASPKAYGAVVYLHNPQHGTHIVCSKSRVAPIKEVAIPRLELMAAVLGVELIQSIRNMFKNIHMFQLWSDSQVVLYWIRDHRPKEKFITNRLQVIQESGLPFRYCPTKDNPADWISRGKPTAELLDPTNLWWNGPQWIAHESEWPEDIPIKAETHLDKDSSLLVNNQQINTKKEELSTPFAITANKYSSWSKLIRITGKCLGFIDRVRQKTITDAVDYQQQARTMWIQYCQRPRYSDQHKKLLQGKSSDHIKQMNLILEDDFIKTQGRLGYASVNSTTNKPILLPKNHPITDLLIKDVHQSLMHQGVPHTLAALRQQFWIPSGRQQVRAVLKKCYICIKWEGRSYSSPFNQPALPAFRVTKNPAFTYVGCDFAGPLNVFNDGIASKTYICLFTCAVTRAIHLELIESMSTTSFLMAFRRFIARRGIPHEIITDNAKSFKQTNEILNSVWKQTINDEETLNYMSSKGIRWRFIVERAPWWGGFYERLVGLTKRALLKSIQRSKLTYIELNTVIAEIEAILNTRPLTHVSNDVEGEVTLQPCNFLTEMKEFAIPTIHHDEDPDFRNEETTATRLLERLRIRQKKLDKFWKLWEKDYLTSLREVHHRAHTNKGQRNRYRPKVGDVVLIKQDMVKRAHWKLALVKELFVSKDDGEVRAAKLQMKEKLFQRPITHLYPLEIQSKVEEEDHTNPAISMIR